MNIEDMEEDEKIISSGPFKGYQIEKAHTDGVDMYRTISEEFMKRVLGYEPGDYLISDEASLFDFTPFGEGEIGEFQERIRKEYGIDVSDIQSGNLLEIFRRIHRKQFGGV